MDTSKNNFVTVNEILSDVLKLVDDERYETNSKGYYVSLIQQALEELSFDTFFDERTANFDFPTDSLCLEMPIGSFNIKHIYLFSGSECDIINSQKVWWKKNYFTRGNGYFADNKGNNNNDPFFPSDGHGKRINSIYSKNVRESVENHYYYNIQNGLIMFSSKCRVFPKVHVMFNGTGCDLGEIPIIPLFLREAVKLFVVEYTFAIKSAKPDGKQWISLWQLYSQKLNREGIGEGTWYRAIDRVRSMSNSERDDLFEYLNRNAWQQGL